MQQGQVDQQVEGHHGQHPADQGAGQIPLGLAELLGEIDRAGPAVVGGDHRLQGQHGRHGQVLPGGGDWRLRGDSTAAELGLGGQQKAGCHQGQEGHRLDQAEQFLAGAAGPQAPQLDQGEQADRPQGQGLGPKWQQAPGFRQQGLAVFPHGGGHPGQADAVGQPVGPAHQEADPAPEGPLRIHIPAPCPGQAGRQLGDADRPQQRIEPAHQPGRQQQRRRGQLGCDQPRGAQDARPDRAAHGSSQAETQAKDGQEPARGLVGHQG